jgi:hypothetical protein
MNSRYLFFLTLLIMVIMAMMLTASMRLTDFHPAFTWWLLPLLFYVISAIGHVLMTRSIKARPEQFMSRFMLATTAKLLLYLAILLTWYLLQNRSLEMNFITAFALLYISITTLDLIAVLKINKKNSVG